MRRPLRDLADVHYGKSPNEVVHEDGSVPVVGTGGVYGRAVRPLFQGPAIVVPRKGSLGNPQYMSGPFWAVDTTYAVLPKKGVQARWLHYNLDLFDLTKLNEATGVPSISRDWLYKIEFEDPGEASQQRIAEILSTVDEAIEQTEALIAKTQQIRAGLMHDLFTRGVTADGQLRPPREKAPQLYKESPLGWIPMEWEIELVDNFCAQVVDCPHSTPVYVERGVPCIRTADMLPGQLLLDHAYRVTDQTYFERVARLVPRKGDIIYSREGERLGIASPVGDELVCLGQRVMLLRPSQDTDPAFMLWAMNTEWFYRRVVSGLGATTSPHVNVGDIRSQILVRPWKDEQERIGANLSAVQEKLEGDRADAKKLLAVKHGLMRDLLAGSVQVTASSADGGHGMQSNTTVGEA